MIRTAIFASTLAFAALSPVASSASGWTAKQKSSGTGATQSSDLTFDNDFFRVDQEDNTSVIIDLSSGKFTFLQHAKKQHASITVEQLLKTRDEMLSRLKAQLGSMPPEVKKQMEAQLKALEGSGAKSEIAPKATGRKDKINGYDCAVYQWTAPDGDGEACIASKVGVDVGEFTKATAKLSDKLSAMSGGRGSPTAFAMLQLGKHGFPVRTKRTIKMGPTTIDAISEISDIKAAKVDPSKFQVPKGYTEGDLQNIMGAGPPPGGAPPAAAPPLPPPPR